MKRTTIFIPEPLEADLQVHARRTRKPVAWVVREAVTAYLATHAEPPRTPQSIGLGDSGRPDVSARVDELLFADRTPADDRVGQPRARAQRSRRRRKS